MPYGYVAAAAVGAYGSIKAGKESARGAGTQADAEQRALDYQMEIDEMPLAMRNEFMPMIAGYYRGGEGQQAIIDDVRNSPIYSQMIQQGQEGVMANAQNKGLSRSGNAAIDFRSLNQDTLNSLVNQKLGGMSSLANMNLNTNAIASNMGGVGRTLGQGQIAQANANQQGYGTMFNAILQGTNEYNRENG